MHTQKNNDITKIEKEIWGIENKYRDGPEPKHHRTAGADGGACLEAAPRSAATGGRPLPPPPCRPPPAARCWIAGGEKNHPQNHFNFLLGLFF